MTIIMYHVIFNAKKSQMTAEKTENNFLKCSVPLWLRTLGGAVAQLGARLNGIQKVRGSNPLSSTNKFKGF